MGKTQFGRMIINDPAAYLNFDIPAHRVAILGGELPPTAAWFFDEIHKYRAWRNYLKGLYDAAGGRKRILVTGSARLDFYRFGGDSLQRRYYYLRQRFPSVPAWQISAVGKKDFETTDGIRVAPAVALLRQLV